MEHHLRDLDTRIAALQKTRLELEAMIDRGQALDPADCADPHRCQTIAPRTSLTTETGAELHGAPIPHRH